MYIELIENFDDEISEFVDKEFNKFAFENNLICNYLPFNFVAKEGDKIIGILTGHSYYKEVYISDFIVLEQYRNKHIGTALMEYCIAHFKDREFDNINLTTYRFQAPQFYEKQGFKLEFTRENKKNPKLTKYFYVRDVWKTELKWMFKWKNQMIKIIDVIKDRTYGPLDNFIRSRFECILG